MSLTRPIGPYTTAKSKSMVPGTRPQKKKSKKQRKSLRR